MSTTHAPPAAPWHRPLDEISTHWTQIRDPVKFVLRYSRAIQAYLLVLLTQPHDADDVAQEFVMQFWQRGLAAADPDRGRFRDYLKVAVRRAAIAHLRQQGNQPLASADLNWIVALPDENEADSRWQAEWRTCLLDRAWRGIDNHVRRHPSCGFDVALRLAREQPQLDSAARACVAAAELGRPVSAAAFRQMLKRARALLKELLIQEVAKTLREPTPASIEQELADLELLSLVRD